MAPGDAESCVIANGAAAPASGAPTKAADRGGRGRHAGRVAGRDVAAADTLGTLRGIPVELIGWEMKNTHRLDIVLDPTPGQRPTMGWSVLGGAIPIEERSHVRQDRSAFGLDASENGGYAEHEPTIYLLPYYMALYHGFIE